MERRTQKEGREESERDAVPLLMTRMTRMTTAATMISFSRHEHTLDSHVFAECNWLRTHCTTASASASSVLQLLQFLWLPRVHVTASCISLAMAAFLDRLARDFTRGQPVRLLQCMKQWPTVAFALGSSARSCCCRLCFGLVGKSACRRDFRHGIA